MDLYFFIIVAICAFIAGMGIGGGSIFLLLSSIFSICDYTEAQIFNLIMFIAVGISTAVYSIKNKTIDTDILKKMVFFVLAGSIVGVYINKIVDKNLSEKIFLGFMISLGIYEIISSVKKLIQDKINQDERS